MHLDFSRHRFAIPEASNSRHTWVEREALFLAVTCPTSGVRGFGEASPLPGYSVDDVDACEGWLTAHRHELPSFDDALTWLAPAAPSALHGAPPAVRCALETALLDGYCRSRDVSPVDVLRSLTHYAHPTDARLSTKLAWATLLDVYDNDHAARAMALSDAGYHTFKVKVGRGLGFETRALTNLAKHFTRRGRPLTLRLDANQSLRAAQLAELGRLWCHLPIEYVEEPCAASELNTLDPTAPLGFGLAFDESLATGLQPLKPWLAGGQVRGLVCKPMYLGGVSAAMGWADVAREHGVQLVLSHLFDGPLALAHYRDLAWALAPGVVAGLAPHRALSSFAAVARAWREERGYDLRDLPELEAPPSLATQESA